jgi:hypothetical protein
MGRASLGELGVDGGIILFIMDSKATGYEDVAWFIRLRMWSNGRIF